MCESIYPMIIQTMWGRLRSLLWLCVNGGDFVSQRVLMKERGRQPIQKKKQKRCMCIVQAWQVCQKLKTLSSRVTECGTGLVVREVKAIIIGGSLIGIEVLK